MIFDNFDYEFLRLAGICRYVPTGLCKKYDSPIFKRRVIYNLMHHRLIKMLNDKKSYKLTKRGRNSLRDMGIDCDKDARTDVKKTAYKRKLKNAQWNIVLTLAGIDIYSESARQLANSHCKYLSSLGLRADDEVKVLAGTKFLGILKIADIAYIPYYVEDINSWILPSFERDIYESQAGSIGGIRKICCILIGESLEELWKILNNEKEVVLKNGRKNFKKALEELSCDYLLVPFGRDGVKQMSVIKILRYRERISEAIGCMTIKDLPDCDGIKDGIPYIIAIDCNVRRIIRALRQVERYNKEIIPRVCCLQFQKNIIVKMIKKYKLKCIVTVINEEAVYKVFPELMERENMKKKPFEKEGNYVDVVEIRLTEAERENIPE